MSNNYYYEQPYEDTTSTTTTTVEPPPQGGSTPPSRKLIVIGLIAVGAILLILLLFLLINNSSGNNTQNNTSTLDSTKKVNLQFRGAFISKDIMQPLIDDYQKLHSNVTIDYADLWPTNTAYQTAAKSYKADLDKVLKEGDSVNIPDIFMVNNTWAGDYDGIYTSASPNIDIKTFSDSFYPAAVTDFTQGNIVHGVPLWMDTFAIIYNEDLLNEKSYEKPASNWTDFKTQAKALTKTQNGNIVQAGFAAGTSNNVSYPSQIMNLLLAQEGVTMTDPATGAVTFASNPTSITALSFYASFNGSTWDDGRKMDAADFLEGKLAMMVGTSYRYRDLLKFNQDYNLKLKIGIAPMPQDPGQTDPLINWSDYWGAMVAKKRPYSAYAWDFLNWLTQPDQLKKFSQEVSDNTKSFGILYPRKDMNNLLEQDDNLKVFNSSLPFAKSWYMGSGLKMQDRLSSIVNGTINLTNIQGAQDDMNNILKNKGQL